MVKEVKLWVVLWPGFVKLYLCIAGNKLVVSCMCWQLYLEAGESCMCWQIKYKNASGLKSWHGENEGLIVLLIYNVYLFFYHFKFMGFYFHFYLGIEDFDLGYLSCRNILIDKYSWYIIFSRISIKKFIDQSIKKFIDQEVYNTSTNTVYRLC